MWEFRRGTSDKALLKALSNSLALIEFDLEGRVLTANENFCRLLGYDLAEIKGRHHSNFVEPDFAGSPEYQAFWTRLKLGKPVAAEFQRIGKNGRAVWLQASYNPVRNPAGKVVKVVKQATNITAEKMRNLDISAKINALSRVQAIIEFSLTGDTITANENFLRILDYELDEVVGQHHSMFVEPAYARSPEYQDFWSRLNAGEAITAEFKRIGKGGQLIWLQASYNPVCDPSGRVVKVVKFATDVTSRVLAVNAVAHGLTRLADNNLTHRIDDAFDQAFDRLRLDFNTAVDRINATMVRLVDGSASIEARIREVSSAGDDLSRRTEQQAASLEQTAAALDQITTTVKRSAEGAADARRKVAVASSDARNAEQVVERAISAMTSIEASSRQIGQIIGVIDEIAFQTNLLALNAGVEAARAGEAGRGFAVVALEVRALAQRSAEAAKEIKTLISGSAQQVEVGVSLVGDTGQVLARIVVQVSDINQIVDTMATSTREQATALDEVNTAINQMDQVTQQNAAMVEQTAASTQAMLAQAADLKDLISQFETGRMRDEPATNQHSTSVVRAPLTAPPHRERLIACEGYQAHA